MTSAEYCRELEAHLCRKNDGHLIRIVGPAFEQVCGWAIRGIPLKVAFLGIDQYCERYYARGPKRRPVRIEFCEADILDLFDAWRRAVGVSGADLAGDEPRPKKPALAMHIERAVARLTGSRAGKSARFDAAIDGVVRELDGLAADARHARGHARERIVARLGELDAELAASAANEISTVQSAALAREAQAELAPFKARMPQEAWDRAIEGALRRLTREALGIPLLAYE